MRPAVRTSRGSAEAASDPELLLVLSDVLAPVAVREPGSACMPAVAGSRGCLEQALRVARRRRHAARAPDAA